MNKLLNWVLRHHRFIHVGGELSLTLVMLSGAFVILNDTARASTITLDPLQTRARTELAGFTGWLKANNAQGYVGEIGWPDNSTGDAAAWNALANIWYQDADSANLWVTPWSTGIWWGTTYKLSPYQNKIAGGGVDSPNTQASVLEAHPPTSTYRRGVNVSGAEFGTGGSFNNANPGTYGTNYIYDPTGTFNFLASRNENIIRLPIRWERIQHTIGGALDASELQRLTDAVNRAGSSGLGVIIDLHNYGEYQTPAGRQTIGQGVSLADFSGVWQLLSQAFKGNSAVVAYDIMNEPHDLGGANPTKTWEQASQSALTAIRANGDAKLIMIPGYNWSGAASWAQTHASGWISDPSNNYRYEAHHYWDRDSSGVYANSYASEVANASSRGYASSQYVQPAAPTISSPAVNNAGPGTANTPPAAAGRPGASPQAKAAPPTPAGGTHVGSAKPTLQVAPNPGPLTPAQSVQAVLVKSATNVAGISSVMLALALGALFALEIKLRRIRIH